VKNTANSDNTILYSHTNYLILIEQNLFHFACTWAVWTASVHFQYLKNWSCGLDVTRQPVRGDLTVHP